jgi:hypothetical protein
MQRVIWTIQRISTITPDHCTELASDAHNIIACKLAPLIEDQELQALLVGGWNSMCYNDESEARQLH